METSQQLGGVVAIMDMDCFAINKGFCWKELGFLGVGVVASLFCFFDFGLRGGDLLPNDMGERADVSGVCAGLSLGCHLVSARLKLGPVKRGLKIPLGSDCECHTLYK